ncbi:MAG: PadR family transcriptional regulator, partial [Actinomycetota bacterium]
MTAAGSWTGDCDPHLFDALRSVADMGRQLHRAAEKMHAGSRGGGPGRQWGGGFGGFGGQAAGWWPGAPGQPGPAKAPKAGRGDVRAAILAVLSEGPRNGYQIMSEIEE